MAAKADKTKTTMVLEYVTGQNEKGEDVIKKQRFSKVKTTADDQSIYDVAIALAPLMKYGLNGVSKEDESEISA